jgi:hypothetical protein
LFGNEHDRENRGGTTTTAWIWSRTQVLCWWWSYTICPICTPLFSTHTHTIWKMTNQDLIDQVILWMVTSLIQINGGWGQHHDFLHSLVSSQSSCTT